MSARHETGDPVALVQLNGDLRHAHAELQSAHRAAQRLRVRFTVEEIARHAEPAMLSTAQAAATGLYNFFSSIPLLTENSAARDTHEGPDLDENQVLAAIGDIAAYMSEQRDKYRPMGEPLDAHHLQMMSSFFSPSVLSRVRIVELAKLGLGRLEIKRQANSYHHLLELTHMASVTFEDVVVFNEALSARSLFHALVHAVQFQLLGLPRYTELFVRAFVATRWRFNVPLEAHAFELESRFAANREQAFFVEDEVRLWISRERY
ncbi:MAG: hypothetical protein ABSG69_04440 [Candidatus Acidiferrum sp.]|jgi:hypothetical protein